MEAIKGGDMELTRSKSRKAVAIGEDLSDPLREAGY